MIVKVNYDEIKGEYVTYKGKQAYMRIVIDDDNMIDALDRFRDNEYVVAFDYKGKELNNAKNLNVGDKVIIGTLDGTDDKVLDSLLKSESLDTLLKALPSYFRVVIKLNKEFKNIRKVYEFEEKYPNVVFCGGNLIRLKGLKLGCIQPEDIKNKDVSFKSYVTDGECSCLFDMLDFAESSEDIEFSNRPVNKVKIKKAKSESKREKNTQGKKKSKRVVEGKAKVTKNSIKQKALNSMISRSNSLDDF